MRCTCTDTTGTVIQSMAIVGEKMFCMICRREITRDEQEEALRRRVANR